MRPDKVGTAIGIGIVVWLVAVGIVVGSVMIARWLF